MFQADIPFIKNDKFYDQVGINGEKVTGYELFFQIIEEFKNKFNLSIHVFGEVDKAIQISFKGDYLISLKDQGNKRYIELYFNNDSIEDFTEKYNYLKEMIS